jgi:hypothetical protein
VAESSSMTPRQMQVVQLAQAVHKHHCSCIEQQARFPPGQKPTTLKIVGAVVQRQPWALQGNTSRSIKYSLDSNCLSGLSH